jgi:hypothetical protein
VDRYQVKFNAPSDHTVEHNDNSNGDNSNDNGDSKKRVPNIATAAHFIKPDVLLVVSSIGDLTLLRLNVSDDGFSCRLVCVAPDDDSLPTQLGGCCSAIVTRSNNNNNEHHRSTVYLALSVDAWTSQLFSMEVLSTKDSMAARISEGLFSSALQLANKYSYDLNIVYKMQWEYLRTQHFMSLQTPLSSAKYGSRGKPITIDDVLHVFDAVSRDHLEWIVSEALLFRGKDLAVWGKILLCALEKLSTVVSLTFSVVNQLSVANDEIMQTLNGICKAIK